MANLNESRTPERKAGSLNKILNRLEKIHPDAKLDLDFSNPLELLIALILAAHERDALVNQVTVSLFAKYRAAAEYAGASLPALEQEIRKINFYRKKARSIHNCCGELLKRFGGAVPDRMEDLLSLPGVGRKTANIVLGNAFAQQTIGVDTHVTRLAQRLGLTENTHPDKIERDVSPLVPPNWRVRFCHLLQYHGRRFCLARKPRCADCGIRSLCPFLGKNP